MSRPRCSTRGCAAPAVATAWAEDSTGATPRGGGPYRCCDACLQARVATWARRSLVVQTQTLGGSDNRGPGACGSCGQAATAVVGTRTGALVTTAWLCPAHLARWAEWTGRANTAEVGVLDLSDAAIAAWLAPRRPGVEP